MCSTVYETFKPGNNAELMRDKKIVDVIITGKVSYPSVQLLSIELALITPCADLLFRLIISILLHGAVQARFWDVFGCTTDL